MAFNKRNMNTIKTILFIAILAFQANKINAQATATIEIDSISVNMVEGLSFPYWLKSGQKVKPGPQISSISILEFTIDSATKNLIFSQVLKVTSLSTVPSKKAWKIEALSFLTNITPTTAISPAKFTEPGNYYWTVPPGVSRICIEVWGAGGSGASNSSTNCCGGGGGGYAYGCYNVKQGTTYRVKVGGNVSGNGDTSIVQGLIAATGGYAGTTTSVGTGGHGNASFAVSGSSGTGSKGGNGALGGYGGYLDSNNCGTSGKIPGGGGSITLSSTSNCGQNTGGTGQVIIHW